MNTENIDMQNINSSPIAAFRSDERLALDNGRPDPGQLVLANEARFNASFYSEPLTAYAVGWRDQNEIEKTLDFLAPPVQAGRRYEFKKSDNTEAFYSETDDLRAIGADFKRVEYKGITQLDKTLNKGLTLRVDLDQIDSMVNWREVFTTRLLQRLLRNELRRAISLISGVATNTAKTWDTTVGRDPDQDVLTDLIAAVDDSGVRPNRLLYGDVAWNKRLIAHRAQASAGGYASAGLTTGELAGFMGVDGVRVSRERFQSTAVLKGKVVPDVVLEFFAEDGVGPDDPSHAKRFWTAVEGGGKYRVYEQQMSAKLIDLTVEHYSNVSLTSTLGLRKLTIS